MTDKVSLDPYRLESRKIFALVKESLPSNLQRVEKAGIDEMFLDLSAHIHALLLERFPELASGPPRGDSSEPLPMPPVSALDWRADALVDLPDENAEYGDPDWDDVAFCVASEVVRNVRAAIRDKLRYTCAAGIAGNKLLSKLGSAHKKPNQQTVIRNRAVRQFLSGFKFTKFRNLGGKLGEQVTREFGSESVQELLSVPVEQLKLKLGDETGAWVYNTLRGIDTSEVNPRTQIKSMLSAKSFRPSISTVEQATKWLRIFVADIFARLVEEGVLENKRRPRTINLHHRHGGQTRSRQSPIPQGCHLAQETLLALAKNLLNQIVQEGEVWPCSNLSLSVGGFEDAISGNMGIDGFLLKGEKVKALPPDSHTRPEPEVREHHQSAQKRRRMDGEGIQHFFLKRVVAAPSAPSTSVPREDGGTMPSNHRAEDGPGVLECVDPSFIQNSALVAGTGDRGMAAVDGHTCTRCGKYLGSTEVQTHQDWHFAQDLQEEERGMLAFGKQSSAGTGKSRSGGRKVPAAQKRPRRQRKTERGQLKLAFG